MQNGEESESEDDSIVGSVVQTLAEVAEVGNENVEANANEDETTQQIQALGRWFILICLWAQQ